MGIAANIVFLAVLFATSAHVPTIEASYLGSAVYYISMKSAKVPGNELNQRSLDFYNKEMKSSTKRIKFGVDRLENDLQENPRYISPEPRPEPRSQPQRQIKLLKWVRL